MVMSTGANEAVHRSSTMAGDISFEFDNTGSAANLIQALQADGFQVGTDARVNTNGTVYYYVAWNEIAGKMDVGSYSGNATDNRSITGVGFLPQYVIVRPGNANSTVHHSAAMGASTDTSGRFWAAGNLANSIQALEANGFQVGLDATVNTSGTTYHYMAWSQPTLTAVRMAGASATRGENGVTVTWRTGYEVDNVGFEVYREVGGERTRVTSKLIAGSALFVPQGFTTVGRPYTWTDDSPRALEKDVAYWIEDLDLNGKRTLHGPIFPVAPKKMEARSDSEPRDGVQRTATPSDVAAPAPVVNSTLLEELTTVEPRDSSVQAARTDDSAAGVGQARQPQGPIYGGWMAPVRNDRPATPVTSSPKATPTPPSTTASKPASTVTVGKAPTVAAVAPPTSAAPSAAPPLQAQPHVSSTVPAAPPSAPAGATAAPTSPVASPGSAGMGSAQATQPTPPVGVNIRRPPVVTTVAGAARPDPSPQVLQQWSLASQSAVRVMVQMAGWYRLTQAALVAAGINPAVDPKNLRLLVEGVERPIRYVGDENDLSLDPGDAIEFYATGVDTPFTDLRAYWIAVGASPGLRLPTVDATGAGTPAGASFAHTVERRDRTVFFAALQNGDDDNFFGPLVMDGLPTDQDLTLPSVHAGAAQAQVEVALQGVTALAAG